MGVSRARELDPSRSSSVSQKNQKQLRNEIKDIESQSKTNRGFQRCFASPERAQDFRWHRMRNQARNNSKENYEKSESLNLSEGKRRKGRGKKKKRREIEGKAGSREDDRNVQ
jgi:hypothetical protein